MLCLIVSMADVIARQMLYALFGMWQMLLPQGRWLFSFVFLADVIANGMWQMFLPLQCIATIDWLILLPSGRWNSHMLLICFQCCNGQMLLPCGRWNGHILYICDGRCYCPFADGMATAGCVSLLVDIVPRGQMDMGNYFSLSSEVLCRTSSHI